MLLSQLNPIQRTLYFESMEEMFLSDCKKEGHKRNNSDVMCIDCQDTFTDCVVIDFYEDADQTSLFDYAPSLGPENLAKILQAGCV